MELADRIADRRARVVVVGLGYVGWPVTLAATQAGYPVTGLDNDPDRLLRSVVEADGHSVATPTINLTTDPTSVRDADVVIVCVPTPLSAGVPDLTSVLEVADVLAVELQPGTLVSLESTTYPGTTEEIFREKIESGGLVAGDDFALAYSPERIDPGGSGHGLQDAPKLVAGLTPTCGDLAMSFYSTLVSEPVRVTRPREAEMAKLLENTYRQVNIALVNEFAMVAHDLDIDIWEVIRAAATKPFGFEPFAPGIGIGGHCIAVDPVYLTWRIRELGREPFRLVELAREVDDAMPRYVVGRINRVLETNGIDPAVATVLVLGVTYKPDVSDTRESRAIEIIGLFREQGTEVLYNDPFCSSLTVGSEILDSIAVGEAVKQADLVAILTHHSVYDWNDIIATARLVFDARGVTVGISAPNVHRM